MMKKTVCCCCLIMLIVGAVSGCVTGLLAITPAAGYVTSIHAIIIGFTSGVIC